MSFFHMITILANIFLCLNIMNYEMKNQFQLSVKILLALTVESIHFYRASNLITYHQYFALQRLAFQMIEKKIFLGMRHSIQFVIALGLLAVYRFLFKIILLLKTLINSHTLTILLRFVQ